MSTHDLAATARALVADGKGILAADESTGTIQKRFDGIVTLPARPISITARHLAKRAPCS